MPISVDTDVRITVLGTTVTAFDARQRIIRGIENQADVAAVIHGAMVVNADIVVPVHHPLDLGGDTRQAVFAELDRPVDTRQGVVHQLGHNCETGQTVFAVLLNESHVIQT